MPFPFPTHTYILVHTYTQHFHCCGVSVLCAMCMCRRRRRRRYRHCLIICHALHEYFVFVQLTPSKKESEKKKLETNTHALRVLNAAYPYPITYYHRFARQTIDSRTMPLFNGKLKLTIHYVQPTTIYYTQYIQNIVHKRKMDKFEFSD